MTNSFTPSAPLLANQWHLINTRQAGNIGNDVNVLPARRAITSKDVF